jgi:hypothetical protein
METVKVFRKGGRHEVLLRYSGSKYRVFFYDAPGLKPDVLALGRFGVSARRLGSGPRFDKLVSHAGSALADAVRFGTVEIWDN